MTDINRVVQGRTRVRSVAASATAASILAAVGLAFGLPGVTATKASTSTGSAGQKSTNHQTTTTRQRHTSKSKSLQSPTTTPTTGSNNSPQVSSGGS